MRSLRDARSSSNKEHSTSWCRKLPGGCAGKAAHQRVGVPVHGAKCIVPSGTDAGLCRTRANAAALHYVRIAKSGSTSLVEAMQAAQAASRACAKRLVLHSLHEVTATHVERAANATPPPRSFAVLREPCARLASLYHFLRPSPPATDWAWSLRATSSPLAWARLHGENKAHLADQPPRGSKWPTGRGMAEAWGCPRPDSSTAGAAPGGDSAELSAGPVFDANLQARLLLRNASLRASAIRNATDDGRWRLSRHRQPARPVPHYVHYLTAAASAYLTERTDVACFGADAGVSSHGAASASHGAASASHGGAAGFTAGFTAGLGAGEEGLSAAEALRRQVQRIVDRRLGVGTCVLPAVRTRLPETGRGGGVAAKGAARVDRYGSDRTPEFCALAAELYPRDVELWTRRCESVRS